MSNSLRPHGLYVAHRAPLSMGFSRILEWVAIFLLQGNLPDLGIEPMSPPMAGRFFITCATWEADLHTQAPNQPILLEASLSPGQKTLSTAVDPARPERLYCAGRTAPPGGPGWKAASFCPRAPLTAPHPSVSPQAPGGWWRTPCVWAEPGVVVRATVDWKPGSRAMAESAGTGSGAKERNPGVPHPRLCGACRTV